MKLDALPPGAQVLIDANLLIYAAQECSAECRRLLTRCSQHEVSGVVSAVGVAEFCHRRMMQEAQNLGLVASNPGKALGQDPALVQRLTRYAQEMEDLLAGQLTVLSLEAADFAKALEFQRQYGLLTNDSLHLAAGWRASIANLATNDPHFDSVPGMTVFKPDDVA